MKKQNLLGLLIVISIILLGSFTYFFFTKPDPYMIIMKPLANDSIVDSLLVAFTFTPDGISKLFAYADAKVLSTYLLSEGAFLSQSNDVVLGSAEAQMMRNEKLIDTIPAQIPGFFGKDATFIGILKPTKTLLDEMHFVDANYFNAILARNNIAAPVSKVTVYLSPDKHLKLFVPYRAKSDRDEFSLVLSEGSISDYIAYYNGTIINGKTYYPLLIGSIEAGMMRSEYLFSKPGDTIDDLFGNNYIIVGVVAKNSSAIDMIHFVPVGALK